MNEICIPLNTDFGCERAEVEVSLPETGKKFQFRLECIQFTAEESNNSPDRIRQIRNFIRTYNSNWDLVQIMDAPKDCTYIQFLYRRNS